MIKSKLIQLAAVTVILLGSLFGTQLTVGAADPLSACDLDPSSALCADEGANRSTESIIRSIINLLLYILGAAAVLVMLYAAFRFVTSAGNTQAVATARTTMLYAAVGLLVAVFAYAIVNWVVLRTTTSPADATDQSTCESVGGSWSGGSCRA